MSRVPVLGRPMGTLGSALGGIAGDYPGSPDAFGQRDQLRLELREARRR